MRSLIIYFLLVALVPFLFIKSGEANESAVQQQATNGEEAKQSLMDSSVDEDEEGASLDDVEDYLKELNERSLKKGFNSWAGRRNLDDELNGGRPPKRGFNAWAGRRSLQSGNRIKYHRMYDKRRPWGGIARF